MCQKRIGNSHNIAIGKVPFQCFRYIALVVFDAASSPLLVTQLLYRLSGRYHIASQCGNFIHVILKLLAEKTSSLRPPFFHGRGLYHLTVMSHVTLPDFLIDISLCILQIGLFNCAHPCKRPSDKLRFFTFRQFIE